MCATTRGDEEGADDYDRDDAKAHK